MIEYRVNDATGRTTGDSSPYGEDLALVHHRGFSAHAAVCAPGILRILASVRDKNGLVVELGCGAGALTRHLIGAGHRVVATDGSPAMIALTRQEVREADDVRLLRLPDDPIPRADAIVSVGHVLNYLPDEASIDRALVAAAGALTPGGRLIVDLCDLDYGRIRQDAPPYVRVEDDWAVFTRFTPGQPARFVRDITTFVRREDGHWRRSDEQHVNVLVDTSSLLDRLAALGVAARVLPAFGDERLPPGLVAIVGQKGSQKLEEAP